MTNRLDLSKIKPRKRDLKLEPCSEQEMELLLWLHHKKHRKNDLKKLLNRLPKINIYRTPPNECNWEKPDGRGKCLTLTFRNNTDLRDYLLIRLPHTLNIVPPAILDQLQGLELWKSEQNPKETLFYFDRFDEGGKYHETKLLEDRGWIQLRNSYGREWSEIERHKEWIHEDDE